MRRCNMLSKYVSSAARYRAAEAGLLRVALRALWHIAQAARHERDILAAPQKTNPWDGRPRPSAGCLRIHGGGVLRPGNNKHHRPHFGSKKLADLGRFDIQEFISFKERQGCSPQTVAHLRDALSKMFGTAVLWGWLDENPTKGTTLPRMERKRIPRVLGFREMALLMTKLREPARTLFALGVLLGLRIGELLGLKVGDLDLDAGILYVRRSVSRGEIGPTKTPGS